jgi:hypothetical protein
MELTYPIDPLRRRFRGALLRRGEEGNDEARRVWNGAIDRYPALVARCAGADDVTAAVSFVRERDRSVSVKGGGHAVAGHAICDDGIVIDPSLTNRVEVDPGRGRPGRGRRLVVGPVGPGSGHPDLRAGHHRRDRLAHGSANSPSVAGGAISCADTG